MSSKICIEFANDPLYAALCALYNLYCPNSLPKLTRVSIVITKEQGSIVQHLNKIVLDHLKTRFDRVFVHIPVNMNNVSYRFWTESSGLLDEQTMLTACDVVISAAFVCEDASKVIGLSSQECSKIVESVVLSPPAKLKDESNNFVETKSVVSDKTIDASNETSKKKTKEMATCVDHKDTYEEKSEFEREEEEILSTTYNSSVRTRIWDKTEDMKNNLDPDFVYMINPESLIKFKIKPRTDDWKVSITNLKKNAKMSDLRPGTRVQFRVGYSANNYYTIYDVEATK